MARVEGAQEPASQASGISTVCSYSFPSGGRYVEQFALGFDALGP